MHRTDILTYVATVLFCQWLFWFITDPRPIHERLKESMSKKRLPYYLFSGLLILVYLLISYNFYWPSSQYSLFFNIIGLTLYTAGVVLSMWAKITMNSVWGPPAQHDTRRQKKLITTGPFRFTRNPIYLGILLNFIGFSVSLESYSLFICVFFYILLGKIISVEEVLLEKKFGKEYTEYLLRVPRLLKF